MEHWFAGGAQPLESSYAWCGSNLVTRRHESKHSEGGHSGPGLQKHTPAAKVICCLRCNLHFTLTNVKKNKSPEFSATPHNACLHSKTKNTLRSHTAPYINKRISRLDSLHETMKEATLLCNG